MWFYHPSNRGYILFLYLMLKFIKFYIYHTNMNYHPYNNRNRQ
ncbi:hypothetical protein [Neisseria meningitidis serogroup B]|uniref:Uncharacterized protein n=1 Tax=Neisseria meningitidis serogroup B TaxID=491 RepID=A0A0H5QAU5_NEIMI|nr:hypothetical protein [Neisseria meningitidis serogroup B]